VLTQYFAGSHFNDELAAIGLEVAKHIDAARRLPRVLRFQLALWAVDNASDFCACAALLLELGAPVLIVDLFRRLPPRWVPLSLLATLCEMVPVFSTHGTFPDFLRMVVEARPCPARVEILAYLHEHFRAFPALQFFKAQIADSAKAAKSVAVDCDEVQAIARRHSFLFGLHTLDAFLGIKTPADLLLTFEHFIGEALPFDNITVDAFFDFFVAFSESKCITRASHFFVKTMLAVLLETPELLESPPRFAFVGAFFERAFLRQLLAPEQYLRGFLTGKKRPKAKTPEQVAVIVRLLAIFSGVVQAHGERWTVHALLTEEIVKGFNQNFPSDPGVFAEFLRALRNLPPPVISRDLMGKHIDAGANSGSPYLAALFSLLPDPLHSPDFVDVFDYFKANVDGTTVSFWTFWLKLRPYYVPGFPVTVAVPDKECLSSYRGLLISAFSSLLFRATPGDDRTMIHLQSWVMICDAAGIANTIAESLIDDLRQMRVSLYPLLIDFLHAALLSVSDRVMEAIVDGFCHYHYDEAQFEAFAKLSASIFAVYVFRFPADEHHIPDIAEKLIEWFPKLYEMQSTFIESVLDIFNFVICFTATDRQEDRLQDQLHERIASKFLSLPPELQKLVILNRPRQVFKTVKNPLYFDYAAPDHEPDSGFPLGPTFSPDRGDGSAYPAPFDNNSLFSNFEEEFNATWFWGR
jgi:hypothetical protein